MRLWLPTIQKLRIWTGTFTQVTRKLTIKSTLIKTTRQNNCRKYVLGSLDVIKSQECY